MTLLPHLQLRPPLLTRRGRRVEFALLRRSSAGGLQVLGKGSRSRGFRVQLSLEPGRLRLPLELPSLDGFLRLAQVGAERLDLLRPRGELPIPSLQFLPGFRQLPDMARVFRRGLLRRLLLRLLGSPLSFLAVDFPFLHRPPVPSP